MNQLTLNFNNQKLDKNRPKRLENDGHLKIEWKKKKKKFKEKKSEQELDIVVSKLSSWYEGYGSNLASSKYYTEMAS